MTVVGRLESYIAEGIRWLYEVKQPDGAIIQHHGIHSPVVDDLVLDFCPLGYPVIVVNRARPRWSSRILENPLTPAEVLRVLAAISAAGKQVSEAWNGAGLETGSFRLTEHVEAPAVARYRAGCPTHKSAFCRWLAIKTAKKACTWYADGYARIIQPDWAAQVIAAKRLAQDELSLEELA